MASPATRPVGQTQERSFPRAKPAKLRRKAEEDTPGPEKDVPSAPAEQVPTPTREKGMQTETMKEQRLPEEPSRSPAEPSGSGIGMATSMLGQGTEAASQLGRYAQEAGTLGGRLPTEKVQETAKEGLQGVQDKAKETLPSAGEKAPVGAPETAKEGLQGVQDKAKEGLQEVQDKAKETLPSVSEKAPIAAPETAKEGLQGVQDKAKEGLQEVQDKAKETLPSVSEKAPIAAPETAKEGLQGVQDKAKEGLQEVQDKAKETLPSVGEKAPIAAPEAAEIGDRIPVDLSMLEGLQVKEGGHILDKDGRAIGKVIEGDPEDLVGMTVSGNGEILDEDGDLVGVVEPISPEKAKEVTGAAEGVEKAAGEVGEAVPDISMLKGMSANEKGQIMDKEGNLLGQIAKGQDPGALAGKPINEKGQILDDKNNVIGQVELVPGKVPEAAQKLGEQQLPGAAVAAEAANRMVPDISTLEGLTCNQIGNILAADGRVVGELVEGDPKKIWRHGFQLDKQGQFLDPRGNVVGRVKPLSAEEEEEEEEEEAPFADFAELYVAEEGWVQDENGKQVGRIVEGDPKRLKGYAVDPDGDILDKRGNTIGHAERCEPPKMEEEKAEEKAEEPEEKEEEEEEEEEDLSALEGMTVNKLGNVVDANGAVYGRIVAGSPKKLAGRKVDGKGQIWNDAGRVIGQAELIPEAEREGPEGPFYGMEGLTMDKDGMVKDPTGQIVGRLVEGDAQRLAGRAVDEDGEIIDKAGNVIGRAERWSPEEPHRDVSPMAGRKVNNEGEVRDEDGNLIGKLTQGNLQNLVGKRINDNGYVVDNDGNKVGECTLMQNLPPEPELSPEELEKQRKEKEDADLAKDMCSILQHTLDTVEPLCKQITGHMEKANSTPKEELDEEQLVKDVKPLIEEAGGILQECKGALRALDPDGQVAATAKARSASHEATPGEYQLADLLKQLTQTVIETIEKGRRLIADMPHARRKINPLWALLSEPLFQIIAAVGLLLSGVLGLVSQLLDGLGLGGLLRGLLGGLGIDTLLEGLGLGKITDSLGLPGTK